MMFSPRASHCSVDGCSWLMYNAGSSSVLCLCEEHRYVCQEHLYRHGVTACILDLNAASLDMSASGRANI